LPGGEETVCLSGGGLPEPGRAPLKKMRGEGSSIPPLYLFSSFLQDSTISMSSISKTSVAFPGMGPKPLDP
jgi:hypothetical protein